MRTGNMDLITYLKSDGHLYKAKHRATDWHDGTQRAVTAEHNALTAAG